MSDQFPDRPVFVFAVLLLCAIIGTSVAIAQQPIDAGESSVVVETNLVNVTVSVTDNHGRNVSGLDKSAFSIYDNKQRQEISSFALDDSPASIVVVFDLSGSMTRQKMDQAKVALQRFFENSHPQDEYSLIGLDGQPRVLVDRTRDPDVLTERLSIQPAHGHTALYDACRLAVRQVTHSAYRRHAILIISDGQDNDSHWTLGELRRQLKEDDVPIYAIGINDQARVGSEVALGRNALAEITAITGGRAFFPFDQEEMIKASEQIALELRSQYQLAYRPAEFVSDRKWHQLKITAKPSEQKKRLSVHHKTGYYAVTPNLFRSHPD